MEPDEETQKWTGSFEKYELKETNGITALNVEVDAMPGFENYFNEKFPLALQQIKQLSEK